VLPKTGAAAAQSRRGGAARPLLVRRAGRCHRSTAGRGRHARAVFPPQPQRQRSCRGRAAPRKKFVRRGWRSLRRGDCFRRKPQRSTPLSTPTFPPPAERERGRPTGRARGLLRFSGGAAAVIHSPDDGPAPGVFIIESGPVFSHPAGKNRIIWGGFHPIPAGRRRIVSRRWIIPKRGGGHPSTG